MISPWKRANSANYWFRLAIPARYRAEVGQSEIKLSLQTADVRKARLRCAALHSDWLTKFAAFDVALMAKSERDGVDVVDAYFLSEAASNGGIDAVVSFELEGLALAESAYLDALTTEDIVGTPLAEGIEHPLAETPYPAYRGHAERAMITRRRDVLEKHIDAALLPGLEAAKRALALRFWQIGGTFLEDAFAHADQRVDRSHASFASAGERFLQRLIEHPNSRVATVADALPIPASIAPPSKRSKRR